MKSLFICDGKPLSLIVLAGGSSRRMKKDKALLPVPGGMLIEHILGQLVDHFDEALISLSKKDNLSFLPYKMIVDERPGEGPMMGIQSALEASRNEKSFVIACDIPEINLKFIEKMVDLAERYEIVVPISPGKKKEPLFAIYSRSVVPECKRLLNSGDRSLLCLFEHCKTRFVKMDDSSWYKNINTLEDYESFLEKQRGQHS